MRIGLLFLILQVITFRRIISTKCCNKWFSTIRLSYNKILFNHWYVNLLDQLEFNVSMVRGKNHFSALTNQIQSIQYRSNSTYNQWARLNRLKHTDDGKLFIQCLYHNYNNNNERVRERPSNIIPKGICIKGVWRVLHSPLHTRRKTERLNTKLKINS